MKPSGKKRSQRKDRLDEETWLERALDALAAKGPQVLTVEKLCRELGVSRGSFYWHFKNRADFIRRMTEFWDLRFTVAVRETVAIADAGPEEKLLLLSQIIQDLDVVRYDVPVRALAFVDPAAAEIVARTDKTRYRYVRSLFAELGFSGDKLDMRTRTFVIYHSFDGAFTPKDSSEAIKRRRKLRIRLLATK